MHLNDALHHLIPDVTLLELRDGRVATFIQITGVADRSVVVYEVDTSPDKKQRQRHGVGASGFWSRDSAIQHANDVVAVKCIDPRPASPSGDLSAELAAVRQKLANTKQVAESMTNECLRLTTERDKAHAEIEFLTARLDERNNAVAATTHNMQEACRVKDIELEKTHSELTAATWERDEARRAKHDALNELKDARVRIDEAYQSRLLTCINMLKSALCGHINADTALGAEWYTLLAQVHELRRNSGTAPEARSACTLALKQTLEGWPLRNTDTSVIGLRWHQTLVEVSGLVATRTEGSTVTPALKSVTLERARQIALGKTPATDDKHTNGFLGAVAIAKVSMSHRGPPPMWVEALTSKIGVDSLFGGTPRQLLVEAAACLLADIERMDRIDVRVKEEKIVALKKEVAVGEMAAKELAKLQPKEICGLKMPSPHGVCTCRLPVGHTGSHMGTL